MLNIPKQVILLNLGLLILLACLFVTSLYTGYVSNGLEMSSEAQIKADILSLIIWEIRLPRAILAVLIGGSLGLSGAVLQGWLRNPLVDPGIIGTTATASLGAVIVLYFGLVGASSLWLPAASMLGAVTGIMLLFLLAGKSRGTVVFILAGVVITSFAGAATSLVLNLAPSPYAALEIVFWLLGSLESRSFTHVWIILIFIMAGWAILLSTTKSLYALSLGEDIAYTLGVNLKNMRRKIVIAVGLCVGASVAVAGAIGFIGLVAPHLVRPWVKHRADHILLPSLIVGALLLLSADLAVRLIPSQVELKLGVLTALLGAPFFLWTLMHLRRAP